MMPDRNAHQKFREIRLIWRTIVIASAWAEAWACAKQTHFASTGGGLEKVGLRLGSGTTGGCQAVLSTTSTTVGYTL